VPGIPVGPGTVFYLLAALATPFVVRGRRDAARRQAAIAAGMVCTGALSLWIFDRVGQVVGGSHAPAALLLSSPLLIALVVLGFIGILSRVVRKLSR